MTSLPAKHVVLFASKFGYQTRSFEAAARRLGIQLGYVTDRCHELNDPWGDQAIAVRFARPFVRCQTWIKMKMHAMRKAQDLRVSPY